MAKNNEEASASEQEGRPAAVPTVQLDTARVTVTEWKFAPGAETGWHAHTLDYIVVPMNTAELLLQTSDGESSNRLTTGISYTRLAGSEHNVINESGTEFVFVEIELK